MLSLLVFWLLCVGGVPWCLLISTGYVVVLPAPTPTVVLKKAPLSEIEPVMSERLPGNAAGGARDRLDDGYITGLAWIPTMLSTAGNRASTGYVRGGRRELRRGNLPPPGPHCGRIHNGRLCRTWRLGIPTPAARQLHDP